MSDGLIERINLLKRDRRVVILAHNYQRPEIQDIADFTGDSLELSRKAAETNAGVIVFCGVHFMAETAKILSPEKVVILPDEKAGCPMANMITPEQLEVEKGKYPGVQVVCYVNSSAAVKAASDICCTSANAASVVNSLERNRPILFVPDQYLADYVTRKTGREMLLWSGYCPTHMKITVADITGQRARYPKAKVLVHPECRPDVIDAADDALSTGGMIRYARSYKGETLIIGTETGILHRLRKENPAVAHIPVSEECVCPNMKRTVLEKVLWAIEEMKPRIEVPEETRRKARAAVDRMLLLQ